MRIALAEIQIAIKDTVSAKQSPVDVILVRQICKAETDNESATRQRYCGYRLWKMSLKK